MSLGLLVLRLVVGLLFFGHGAQKLFGWFGGNAANEAAAFARLGLEPAHMFVIVSGTVELGAGLMMCGSEFVVADAALDRGTALPQLSRL